VLALVLVLELVLVLGMDMCMCMCMCMCIAYLPVRPVEIRPQNRSRVAAADHSVVVAPDGVEWVTYQQKCAIEFSHA
jgi:hypothetical protein